MDHMFSFSVVLLPKSKLSFVNTENDFIIHSPNIDISICSATEANFIMSHYGAFASDTNDDDLPHMDSTYRQSITSG